MTTTFENVSKEKLEAALKSIRNDAAQLNLVLAVGFSESDHWLLIITWILLTQWIQGSWHMSFGAAMLIAGGLVWGYYFLKLSQTKKKFARFTKSPVVMDDTDVDL